MRPSVDTTKTHLWRDNLKINQALADWLKEWMPEEYKAHVTAIK